MRGIVMFVALTLGALVASGSASAAGWEKISRDGLANIDEATSVLAGSSIVVAWNYEPAPGLDSSEAITFSSSLSDSVQVPVTVPVVSSWASLNSDPELLTAPDGGIVLAFGGIHSSETTDPLDGLAVAARSDSGAWGAPVVVVPNGSANYGIAGLLLADGSSLLTGDCCGGNAFIFHGATLVGEAAGGGTVTNRTMARDSAGNIWVAWYDLDRGLVMRQIDGTTGVPIGTTAIAPSSAITFNGDSRVALACNPIAPGCRVVYGSVDEHHVLSWAPGEPAPTVVATLGKDDTLGQYHAAYRADGHLWVAWAVRPGVGDPTVRFTLGDVRGAGGTSYPVPLVDAKLDMPYHLRLQPVGDNLLLIGNFTSATGSAQFADLVGIPGAVPDTSGPKDVALEPGAHGKGFRIQVQFKATGGCGVSCKAHAEIRNRTGVACAAACLAKGGKKLPGDGPVVIGTRGTFTLPGTTKVRFYLTVTKAALLRTPFHTEGGFRVGDTRLRVYLTTPSGTVLAVRDGHIKVSIARIKSGALPGLAGIL
jgi:hypothetical protein